MFYQKIKIIALKRPEISGNSQAISNYYYFH